MQCFNFLFLPKETGYYPEWMANKRKREEISDRTALIQLSCYGDIWEFHCARKQEELLEQVCLSAVNKTLTILIPSNVSFNDICNLALIQRCNVLIKCAICPELSSFVWSDSFSFQFSSFNCSCDPIISRVKNTWDRPSSMKHTEGCCMNCHAKSKTETSHLAECSSHLHSIARLLHVINGVVILTL